MNVNELITKMMIISMEAGMVRKKEKFPHSLCGKGVGTYSFSYQFWKILICNRCICVRVRLSHNDEFLYCIYTSEEVDTAEVCSGLVVND